MNRNRLLYLENFILFTAVIYVSFLMRLINSKWNSLRQLKSFPIWFFLNLAIIIQPEMRKK